MLKMYYDLTESAEFLSAKTGRIVSKRDILENVARDRIRACFWFDGWLTNFLDNSPIDAPKFLGGYLHFRGYVQVPHRAISPKGDINAFDAATIIEVTDMIDVEPSFSELPSDSCFMGQYEINPAVGDIDHIPFQISLEDIVIPASDLLHFVSINQSTEKPIITTSHTNTSDKLQHLKQASSRFWGNVDPNDRTTHPNNNTIEAWLIKHGYSPTLAASAATIIRPEWAGAGRKPDK